MKIVSTPQRRQPDRNRPRGSVLVEAALVISLILVPILLSVSTVGLNLVRAVQTNQINRDAGHMFARGVDFSTTATGLVNRGVIFKLAPALTNTTTRGTAVTILSSVEYLNSTTSCPDPCSNRYHVVVTQQIILGNAALKASAFRTVPTGSMSLDGSGKVNNARSDGAVQADGVLSYLTMSDGDIAYISETYFSSADLAIPGFPSPLGTAARAFF